MKVIAFKALFTIEFLVEKQYPRSIIDFSPLLPAYTRKPISCSPLIYISDLFMWAMKAGNLLNLSVT